MEPSLSLLLNQKERELAALRERSILELQAQVSPAAPLQYLQLTWESMLIVW